MTPRETAFCKKVPAMLDSLDSMMTELIRRADDRPTDEPRFSCMGYTPWEEELMHLIDSARYALNNLHMAVTEESR